LVTVTTATNAAVDDVPTNDDELITELVPD
jgi:hypothetical protein